MTYKDAWNLIKSDYQRYKDLIPPPNKKAHTKNRYLCAINIYIHERGFVYTFWLRLASVKSYLRPFFWLVYHHLSSKYGIQISTRTHIGRGLYIGHGIGIVINQSAYIDDNVSLSQFLTIGSNKGKAAIIGNGVYIGPSVCLVENVEIGDNAIIGAGSVVTHNVPDNAVAVGVPAKIIKINRL